MFCLYSTVLDIFTPIFDNRIFIMALFPLLKSVCVPIVDYSIAGVHDYNSLLHKIQAYTAVMEVLRKTFVM